MTKKTNGLLISIEGIDGSGKSSLAQELTKKCKDEGYSVILTKEPGGTPFGMQLRPLLNHQIEPLDPKAEFLCFAADRAQHFAQVILPALKKNTLIISDRMADSSLVYQGYGRGLDLSFINAVNQWAMQNNNPDLVFYVKISSERALQRIIARNKAITSFEKKAFIEATSQGFDKLFAQKTNVITLDAAQELTVLVEQAFTVIQNHYKKYSLTKELT